MNQLPDGDGESVTKQPVSPDPSLLQQTSQSPPRFERYISLLFNFLLVLLGAVYAYYAAKQWESMRLALGQTEESIELNRRALDLTGKALALNARQTKAAEVAASAARASVSVGNKSLQMDQRPYVVITEVTFAPTPAKVPEIGQPLMVTAVYQNVGKSSAVDFIMTRHVLFGNNIVVKLAEFFKKDSTWVEANQTRTILGPSTREMTTAVSVRDTFAQKIAIPTDELVGWDGTTPIIFFGSIEYYDAFGNRFSERFAYQHLHDNTWMYLHTP